ncbi:MAG: methylmalonyl Co-A mutase-associated GTPase MeaB [Rhodocyclales bacterium]|nr:MAG: methylmalonyl Co-A mutase-associated GTPase MeaB [Rhodocyclales bacterium]
MNPATKIDLAAVLNRSRPALARAITLLENDRPGAAELMAELAPRCGRAHVVGVTGAPGAGKSTLINALIGAFTKRGRSVAVVAVDPSSPISGGSILGDRLRMDEHGSRDDVFIRSVSSRGHLGGLSKTTGRVIDVFDAVGYDVVIVETVGAGQSEVEIRHFADTNIVVCPPGLGDDVQAIKAGIIEIADLLVVNKADLPQAERTVLDLTTATQLRHRADWKVKVLKTVATSGEGVATLVDAIGEHAAATGIGKRVKHPSPPAPLPQAGEGSVAQASDDELFAQLRRWRAAGKGVALATVVKTWGSSPRPDGSHLAVEAGGAFVGSVSGGCIEGAVIGEAQAAIADGQPRLLEFGVSDERAWEVGLACGGRVQVFVERVNDERIERLLAERAAKHAVTVVTRLADGAQALVAGDGVVGELQLTPAQREEVRRRLRSDKSGALESSEGALFARCYAQAPRMIIVGAVHITQALAPMAAMAGFEVVVIDPRRAFATAERLPGVTVTTEWPDEALARLGLDAQTAVVTLSHDPKLDDPALIAALQSQAFYIGALGSSRTHAKRVARLTEAGLADAISRIHAPVGLDLGGRSPAEIAVSVLAQVIQVRYAIAPLPGPLPASGARGNTPSPAPAGEGRGEGK